MIRLGIVGYGNLARGVECALRQNPDLELRAVFTRRSPESVKILTPDVPVLPVSEAKNWQRQGSAPNDPGIRPGLQRDRQL